MKLIAFVGSVLLAGAVGVAAPVPDQARMAAGQVPQGLADGPYVHLMAMHHEEGIRMAQLAVKKAANPTLSDLAARIVAGQQKELGELKHFQTTVAEDMAPANQSQMKKMPMNHLEQAAGAAFDRMFLDMMIEHHQDAIRMSRTAKLNLALVQEFARRTTARQEREIKEMQALR